MCCGYSLFHLNGMTCIALAHLEKRLLQIFLSPVLLTKDRRTYSYSDVRSRYLSVMWHAVRASVVCGPKVVHVRENEPRRKVLVQKELIQRGSVLVGKSWILRNSRFIGGHRIQTPTGFLYYK